MDSVPSDIAQKAKVLWLNYPNNPTGAIADSTFFAKAVAFSQRHNVPVLHDAPYTEVAYDGYVPESFLQTPGSMDVGLEFHSLSKSYNMTGWRIGMAVGNAEMINALMRVKSNLDSGIPQAIQYAAIEALNGPQDSIDYHNRVYQDRRDKLVAKLREIGLEVTPPKASLYVWAKLPAGWKSADFAAMLIEEKDIVVTPGAGYGKYGEGYIRLSLTLPDSQLEKGLSRLSDWKIPNPPAN